ncbi:TolB family protein [Larkinella soli]|uniref:TolB family protein n=1 Tax=Larkinella soli TaxID=1770527 RepID=UPI000FFBBF9C|nr:TolB family protein [Larkinella soli]
MIKPLLLALALSLVGAAPPSRPVQDRPVGEFDGTRSIGTGRQTGTARYDAAGQTYQLTRPAGATPPGKEAVQFLWKRLKGDFLVYARYRLPAGAAGSRPEVGWTARTSLEPEAPQVSAAVSADGLTTLRTRRTAGGEVEEKLATLKEADVIQLERRGNTFLLWAARFGEPFEIQKVENLALSDELYVGLFLGGKGGAGVFEEVRITIPAKPDNPPGRMTLGSRLELLDVTTGKREHIFTAPNSIQAPNWTPDGKTLIYNSEGLIYTFDLATRKPAVLNTGEVKNNNNDHVLSFDGKRLGLSSGVRELGGSIIYTVPVTGGTPKQITPRGPSYLHGWSPDGKFLVFCGSRNNEFDVYKIPAEGGDEIRLTDAKGLDDGPEYSPDGRYIYFNSNRTGTMQIWRMKPDGSGQEPVTDGAFNDWFAHISPDGKQMVFLSFLKDEVESGSHPPYKHVYLRTMPVSGGKPRVIAYLYGGQGSINTPSWSPDGRRIAFVSNTDETGR